MGRGRGRNKVRRRRGGRKEGRKEGRKVGKERKYMSGSGCKREVMFCLTCQTRRKGISWSPEWPIMRVDCHPP
jgi:hypothetical protein